VPCLERLPKCQNEIPANVQTPMKTLLGIFELLSGPKLGKNNGKDMNLSLFLITLSGEERHYFVLSVGHLLKPHFSCEFLIMNGPGSGDLTFPLRLRVGFVQFWSREMLHFETESELAIRMATDAVSVGAETQWNFFKLSYEIVTLIEVDVKERVPLDLNALRANKKSVTLAEKARRALQKLNKKPAPREATRKTPASKKTAPAEDIRFVWPIF